MLEFLKAGRAVRGLKRALTEQGRAGVTFAARLTFDDVSKHYGANLERQTLGRVLLDGQEVAGPEHFVRPG